MQTRKWVLIGASAFVALLVLGALAIRFLALNVYRTGQEAYQALDFARAQEQFKKVQGYPSFFGDFVGQADSRLAEVEAYAEADARWQAGDYAGALQAFKDFALQYPDSSFVESSQTALQEIPFDWAKASVSNGDYQAALDIYDGVIQDATMPLGVVVRAQSAVPEVYLAWGQALSQAGSYETAITQFMEAIRTGGGTEPAVQARQELQNAYLDWAQAALAADDYVAAEARYQALLGWQFANAPGSAAETQALLASFYYDWGVALLGQGDYAGAVARHESALALGTPASEPSEVALGQVYLAWGNALTAQGDMLAAGEKYWFLIRDHPQLAASSGVPTEAFEPLLLYVDVLLNAADFEGAATLYEFALGIAGPGREALKAQAYLGWGRALNGIGDYLEALVKANLAGQLNAEQAFLALVDQVKDAAINGLSQLSDDTGLLLMYATLDTVAGGAQLGAEYCATINGVRACISAEGLALAKPALAIDPNERRMLLYVAGDGRTSLPTDMQATRPGHFRYAVHLEESESDLQTCPYTGGHYYVRRRYQFKVTIYDTRTGSVVNTRTIYGSSPPGCPYSHMFFSTYDYVYGDHPSMDEVYSWLRGFVR